jgi:hypothetical protein
MIGCHQIEMVNVHNNLAAPGPRVVLDATRVDFRSIDSTHSARALNHQDEYACDGTLWSVVEKHLSIWRKPLQTQLTR